MVNSKVHKPKVGKIKKASQKANDDVTELLKLAASAPALKLHERKSVAKLFELVVLADLLEAFKAATAGTVKVKNPATATPDVARLAGAPSSADKTKFSYFELIDVSGITTAEAWVSVQFETFSHYMSAPGAHGKASRHELDLMLCKPNSGAFPSFLNLLAGFSCKHVDYLKKDSVREALGFRRELGVINSYASGTSRVPWLVASVPTYPAAPLFLASSSPDAKSAYSVPIDKVGVYVAYVKFSVA